MPSSRRSHRTVARQATDGPVSVHSPFSSRGGLVRGILMGMIRLFGALAAMCFGLAMASVLISDGRDLTGALIALGSVAGLIGFLTNPQSTVMGAAGVVGLGLVLGGRPMEGMGLILLVAAWVISERTGRDVTER